MVLFPIYVTIVNSLLAPDQLVHQPPPLFPTDPQWHDYSAAWTGGQMSKYMATSAIMTAIIVVGQLVTSILAAYAFAFLRFPFKRTLFVICLATLMIPLEVTFITNLDTVTSLHWFNTYAGPVHPVPGHRLRHLPAAPGLPADPTRPAGGGPARRLRAPALHDRGSPSRWPGRRWPRWPSSPSSRAWNQYLWPLVSTGGTTPALHRADRAEATPRHPGVQIPVSLAGAVIAFVPLVILLLVFQKQLVRSLTAGAVK